jgi:SAM-dependent methyltransferase
MNTSADTGKVAPASSSESIYVSRTRTAVEHYPYYFGLLRRFPYAALRRISRKRCYGYSVIEPYVTGRCGLEIGGSSGIFCGNHLIPIYDRCARIDSCDFSSQTIWRESARRRGYGERLGRRLVADASDLSIIPDGTYDFVLASHVMEHIANPLRALQEWKRVLRPAGTVLVVLPHMAATFDHRRHFTSFDHIEADFRANTQEDDLTHLDEVLALHDLSLDPDAGSRQQFRERCLRNSSVRAMHHHVFSPEVLILTFHLLQIRVLHLVIERPFHIVCFAQRNDSLNSEELRLHNLSFLSETAGWRIRNPFRRSKGSIL